MIGVALKGLAGAQAPHRPDRVRDHPRRRDGERHLRPHRHDRQGVQAASSRSPTPTRTSSSPARAADISFQGDTTEPPPIPEGRSTRCARLPGVEAATGSVVDQTNTKILTKEGKAVNTGGAPSFGFGIDPAEQRVQSAEARRGHVADRRPARSCSTPRPRTKRATRSATRSRSRRCSRSRSSRSSGSRSTARSSRSARRRSPSSRSPRRSGSSTARVSSTRSRSRPRTGVTPEAARRPSSRGARPRCTVRTGGRAGGQGPRVGRVHQVHPVLPARRSPASRSSSARSSSSTRFSITVAQRTREFATLRTIGASRRQLLQSVILEALVIGFVASLIGLFAGLGLAIGLKDARSRRSAAACRPRATCSRPRTIVVSILVGVVVTLLAGTLPGASGHPRAADRGGARGRRASERPLRALRAVRRRRDPLARRCSCSAWRCSRTSSDTAPRLLSIAGGVLLLFIGVAMLSRWIVKPLAAIVGWPATRIGGAAGRLARGNSMRNPRRTASTAAALMIGVALVTFVAVLANGFKASNRDAIESQVQADFVVTAQDGFTPFVAGAGDALADSRRGRGGLVRCAPASARSRTRTSTSPGSTPRRSASSTPSTGPRARTTRC